MAVVHILKKKKRNRGIWDNHTTISVHNQRLPQWGITGYCWKLLLFCTYTVLLKTGYLMVYMSRLHQISGHSIVSRVTCFCWFLTLYRRSDFRCRSCGSRAIELKTIKNMYRMSSRSALLEIKLTIIIF